MSGFNKPTTTQTPDTLFDYWLPRLATSELRALLFLIRRCYGFGKEADTVSLDQFLTGIRREDGTIVASGCGLRNRTALVDALRGLETSGLLYKTKFSSPSAGDQTNRYSLRVREHPDTRAEYGFRPLNTTPVPDELFDVWLERLTDAELRVLLYIVRHTLGWRKTADTIRPAHFKDGIRTREGHIVDEGCGVKTDETLYKALAGLEAKTLILRERQRSPIKGNLPTRYSLVFEGDLPYVLTRTARRTPEDLEAEADQEPSNHHHAEHHTSDGWGYGSPREGDTLSRERGVLHAEGEGYALSREPSTHSRATRVRGREEALRGQAHPQQTHIQDTPPHQDTGSKVRSPIPTAQHRSGASTSNDGDGAPLARQEIAGGVGSYESDATERPPLSAASAGRAQMRADPAYQALLVAISDLAEELGDEAPIRSSATRAYHLMQDAGVTLDDFLHLIAEADALTWSAQARVHKRRSGDGTEKNLMPYFFEVLDRLAHPDAHPPRWPTPRPSPEGPLAADDLPVDTVPIGETHPIWRAVLEELRLVLTPENFTTWLAGTRVVGGDENLIHVGVDKPFHKDWLDHKLHGRVMQALERLGYGDVRIRYVVAPAGS